MVNSVVTGDFSAFEVPLSYVGPLYNPCNLKAAKSKLKSFFLSTYSHSLSHKKELDVYHRVPGSSEQKTDFGRFGEHPTNGTFFGPAWTSVAFCTLWVQSD